jgi:alcohol dehydrogenase class IV
MVKPFQFSRVPVIRFKNGMIDELPSFAALYGTRLAIVTGKSSFLKSYQAEKLFNDLKKSNCQWHLIIIPGEPTPDMIDDAVKQTGSEKIDLVIGIGGGSVLDAGKAISAMLYKTDSVRNIWKE